ncbi:PTS system D-glucose-specific IIA component (Glc family) [Bisgaardia hudsonensis]|uniref:PTS system glucose-specific EIIA component n=1 Tax=Bisgaardia hudsonensis TaxID=109472 RepID=A0A4R2N1P1_9PAST|nr:PTS glucose transporter subunit IIA [Bisgaardia hudsonensis]QLB12994.1 PTS glucose transporter subunit IIA [Bisgaardia hudsonensis]TCP13443.1 PTS system D-glucose-specific IIA component (Glc family) [Bisgaardia hudsonensis]
MGFLDRFNKLFFGSKEGKATTCEIYAPVSGEIVSIEDVPDVVFSEKIVGDGVAIRPTDNRLVAPVDGVIGKIFETNHAFSMESKDGVELFVHFGIDTVELKGEGFTRIAQEGQEVKHGDTIIELDLAFLESKAKSVLTPVVISNMDEINTMDKKSGTVVAGESVVLVLNK